MSNEFESEALITFPVEHYTDGNYHVLSSSDETKKHLDIPVVVQADSLEDATRKYWQLVSFHIEYLEERSNELDKWKPFQKGNWKMIGGSWFTIFGLHIYFRYGKGMKGGKYLPFTNLNISFSNYWRRKKKNPEQQ